MIIPLIRHLEKSIKFETQYGEFEIEVFYDGNDEAIVLKLGELRTQENVLCRIQSECISHFFLGEDCDCR